MLADNFKLEGAEEGTAKNVAEAVVQEIVGERARAKVDYDKNWKMYQGKHTDYFIPRYKEPEDIFQYRKDNAVVCNLVGFSVNLSARYLYGRASKVIRKYSKNKETQKRFTELAKRAELDNLMLDASKKAAIFGKVTARNVAVDYATGLQPVGKSTPTTYPHPILMDPMNTFVKRNRWGKIIAVVCKYSVTNFKTSKISNVTELIVDDSRWTWVDEGDLSLALGALSVPLLGKGNTPVTGKLLKTKNSYKLSDEFVEFVNNDDERSDIQDIMDLNIAFDEALTDKRHFFNKHGWPQLVTEVSLENVQHSPNKIWEITPDGDDSKKVLDRLGFLTWDGKMSDYKEFVENLERLIYIQSNTAAISTGDLKAIGQLRSGAALITAHSVAIHKTEEKQIIWERNEKALIRAMAGFDSHLAGTKVENRYRDLEPIIKFPRDFVPGAEHERAQIQQIQINSHLRPLDDILLENDPECVEEEVLKDKYNKILQDSKNISDSTREFKTEQQGATGKSGTSMQKSKEQK